MSDNRRSTNQIIDVLNSVRADINQNKYRNENGEKPVIIVGEMISALRRAKELSNAEPVYSLSRHNITSNAMKKEIGDSSLDDKLIEELSELIDEDELNDYKKAKKVVEKIPENEVEELCFTVESLYGDVENYPSYF